MNNNKEVSYLQAEKKALAYFQTLKEQVREKEYVSILIKDIALWKHNHIRSFLFLRGKKKPDQEDYSSYIRWLNYTGKLDSYLNRSISYIYLRDLGKRLDKPETQTKIRDVVENLKNQLIPSAKAESVHKSEISNMASLYRWAQKEGIESAVIWLINKLKTVAAKIPKGMDAEHAIRKLIKIIAGVIMHVMEEMGKEITPEERARKLDEAIRLGYSYGLTYPFIDDLLDANILSDREKRQYSNLIRTTLLTGFVPDLGEWTGKTKEFISYAHSELQEAFNYIKKHQHPETSEKFFEEAYVFYHSQEVDRMKDLSYMNYTNEELYIPIILKSSYSRLIARSVTSASEDEGFDNRTFLYGIYNQLADDFADMFDDLKDGAVTPYTYYLKYHEKRPDLINPFELYWTVIANLIHHVYDNDKATCEVILDRAINGLKRFKERMGTDKYKEVINLFTADIPQFNQVIQKMVRKSDNVDFFDKLLRDYIITILKNERQEREDFLQIVETARSEIEPILHIPKVDDTSLMNYQIIDAANYSLSGSGKRLRPIMTWVMGVKEYGLKSSGVIPLLKSLEYMHTASLIFDDLPSQDNASIRRGRRTLHQVYNVAVAELTGLFLTQRAIEEQTLLEEFDPKTVLKLIQYSAKTAEDMCRGQAMDLDSKGKALNLEQLKVMCMYKTGIAFEAALIMPAILAHANEAELKALKKFAHHAGIAFQIKDDLLDVEGDQNLLGKTVGIDAKNKNATFVSILGKENAKKEMWEEYCLAVDAIEALPRKITFLKHLLNYIINRDN